MSPQFLIHRGGLFWNYHRSTSVYDNQYFDGEEWRCDEDWFLSIRLEPKWFGYDDFYYDGHTVKSITFLGITLGKGYSYDARPLTKWDDK